MKKLLIVFLSLLSGVPAASAADRPNILFVYTDDQASWALGASDDRNAQTPNMDRLARDGAYLTSAFTTTPVCSPSRASLMASRYGSELGITDWIDPGREPELGLAPDVVTWPEVLQQQGYATGLVGKWHLGMHSKFHPTRTGFDYFMGFLDGVTSVRNPKLEKDGRDQKIEGYTVNILTDHAIEFVRRNQSQPFLLCLHYRAPHTNWLPLEDADWDPFKSLNPTIPNPGYPNLDIPRVKKYHREYLGSVHSVDRNLGRLMDTLDELDLTQRTIVIFTSDHGYNMGHNGIWHKGNGHWIVTNPPPALPNIPINQRPNMYDHSIRVPTAVRWPGVIQPGSVIDQTTSNLDWYPTILAMAGAKLPSGIRIRGRDITPLLMGESIEWDNDFYAEYSTHQQSRTHMRMYRTPEWKLVRDFLNPDRDELYYLTEDPAEATNLVRSNSSRIRGVIDDLHAKIVDRMQQNGDKVLTSK